VVGAVEGWSRAVGGRTGDRRWERIDWRFEDGREGRRSSSVISEQDF
jgi:hypothetical protein